MRRQVRPQVEALESMTLLSGAGAALHHAHAAAAVVQSGTTAAGMTITLSGTQHGTYRAHRQNPDTGTHYRFTAHGQVSPIGHASAKGSFDTPGFIVNGQVTGSMTLRSRRGTLDLSLQGTASGFSTGPFDLNYTITGGTGAFAGDSGSGTVLITLRPSPATTANGPSGRITLQFNPTAA